MCIRDRYCSHVFSKAHFIASESNDDPIAILILSSFSISVPLKRADFVILKFGSYSFLFLIGSGVGSCWCILISCFFEFPPNTNADSSSSISSSFVFPKVFAFSIYLTPIWQLIRLPALYMLLHQLIQAVSYTH